MRDREKNPVSVALVGTSGMGLHYLLALFEEFSPEAIELLAVVDPFPEKSERYAELRSRGIPIFPSLDEFYESRRFAELVIISSPIHFHIPQSCEALRHRSHVLCEKPLGAAIQDVERMIEQRDLARRWVRIGYQWSYSKAVQALKKDILKGKFGKPVRLKSLYLWPRDESYYRRSSWAGKKKDEGGNWILDSPANNAMAHYLHNMFYVLGGRVDTSARPVDVMAELYRAYAIENYDSVAARAHTEEGVEILFFASHATSEERGPMFSFEFENAKVTYGEYADDIIATDRQGAETHYGSPEAEHPFLKLFDAVEAVRKPKRILCGPEAAGSQTLCMNGIQESFPKIVEFPESMVHYDRRNHSRWVKGLSESFYDCYQKRALPSEAGCSWASEGRLVDLRNYQFFPGGVPPENKEK
jgi:predicted dehydrogenase